MARPGLLRHRKFVRMERMPGMTKAIALGSLELLWSAAYETGEDVVGTPEDIELAADWRGERGQLFAALRDAGLPMGEGFIEEVPDHPGIWRVHDLYDHAPEYVQRRMEREAARTQKGQTIFAMRSRAGKEGAKARWGKEKMANDGNCPPLANPPMAKVLTPAPAPAPIETTLAPNGAAWKQVSETWERVCVPAGYAKPRETARQRKLAQARMRDPGWFDAFTTACGFFAREPFYRGKNDRGWAATIAWLMKPGKAEEIAERSETQKPKAPTSDFPAGIPVFR